MSTSHSTSNMFIASYILAKGIQLMKHELEGEKVVFTFGNGAKELAMDYYNGGQVEARRFVESYNMIRDLIRGTV